MICTCDKCLWIHNKKKLSHWFLYVQNFFSVFFSLSIGWRWISCYMCIIYPESSLSVVHMCCMLCVLFECVLCVFVCASACLQCFSVYEYTRVVKLPFFYIFLLLKKLWMNKIKQFWFMVNSINSRIKIKIMPLCLLAKRP